MVKSFIKRNRAKKAKAVPKFQIEPVVVEELEYTMHLGFRIPKILADLRDQLEITNGLKQNGIFRESGKETEIISLFEEYTSCGKVSQFDSHNSANLMKRWFKAWSGKRLLGDIPQAEFLKSPNIDVASYLQEPRLSIWKWLLQLLLDTYTFREYNKMSAKNLAIVWTPAIVGEQETTGNGQNLDEMLIATQLGTTLLTTLIENNGNPVTGKPAPSLSTMRTHTRTRSVSAAVAPDDIIMNSPTKSLKKLPPPPARQRSPTTVEGHSKTDSPGPVRLKSRRLESSNSYSELPLPSEATNINIENLKVLAQSAQLPPPIWSKELED